MYTETFGSKTQLVGVHLEFRRCRHPDHPRLEFRRRQCRGLSPPCPGFRHRRHLRPGSPEYHLRRRLDPDGPECRHRLCL